DSEDLAVRAKRGSPNRAFLGKRGSQRLRRRRVPDPGPSSWLLTPSGSGPRDNKLPIRTKDAGPNRVLMHQWCAAWLTRGYIPELCSSVFDDQQRPSVRAYGSASVCILDWLAHHRTGGGFPDGVSHVAL